MRRLCGAVDQMLDLARRGQDVEARAQIRVSLQARQSALSTAVARLLVENNETEELTAQRVAAEASEKAAAKPSNGRAEAKPA